MDDHWQGQRNRSQPSQGPTAKRQMCPELCCHIAGGAGGTARTGQAEKRPEQDLAGGTQGWEGGGPPGVAVGHPSHQPGGWDKEGELQTGVCGGGGGRPG